MNVTRIRATNLRSYPDLDLRIPAGAVGIVGENGAGKSTILTAIDVCLFGPEGRSLEPYLSEHAVPGDTLTVEVELDHGGERYRIRRTFTSGGRGKSSCEFAQLVSGYAILTEAGPVQGDDPSFARWEPLTQGDQKETQALIERTLGLTRETFRASAMLAQGEGGSFAEAQPRERKRILSDALGLHFWDGCKTLAAADKRVREQHVQNLDGRLGFLAEQTAQRDEIAETVADLEQQAETSSSRAGELADRAVAARLRHEELQARAQAAAQARVQSDGARAEQAALAREQQAALEAQAGIAVVESELPRLRARADELTALEAERETLHEQRAEQERKRAETTALGAELQSVVSSRKRAKDAGLEATRGHTAALERVEALRTQHHERCDRCGQTMGEQARDHAIESNQKEAADYAARAKRAQGEERDLAAREQEIRAELDRRGEDTDAGLNERWDALQARGRDLAGARENLAAAAERLAGLQATAAIRETFSDELAAAEQKVRACEQALRDADEPEPGTVQRAAQELTEAVRALDIARAEAEQVRVQLAAAKARLETLDGYVVELERTRAERDRVAGELAELELLEQAFGRNGVPTWILETSAIPALEIEADRLLALLGSDYRVELRTEREKKSGGTSETLDVVLLTPSGERDYGTFSGGERTRLNLALRLALARLLAHRRGAESGLLAIDEPEFLDTAGTERLVDALRELHAGGEFETVLLVSHVPALRDAFDTTLAVTKTDGTSEVVVA